MTLHRMPSDLPSAMEECLRALATALEGLDSWRDGRASRIGRAACADVLALSAWDWDTVSYAQQLVAFVSGMSAGVACCRPERAVVGPSAWHAGAPEVGVAASPVRALPAVAPSD